METFRLGTHYDPDKTLRMDGPELGALHDNHRLNDHDKSSLTRTRKFHKLTSGLTKARLGFGPASNVKSGYDCFGHYHEGQPAQYCSQDASSGKTLLVSAALAVGLVAFVLVFCAFVVFGG